VRRCGLRLDIGLQAAHLLLKSFLFRCDGLQAAALLDTLRWSRLDLLLQQPPVKGPGHASCRISGCGCGGGLHHFSATGSDRSSFLLRLLDRAVRQCLMRNGRLRSFHASRQCVTIAPGCHHLRLEAARFPAQDSCHLL
jgi:hypothetical protein